MTSGDLGQLEQMPVRVATHSDGITADGDHIGRMLEHVGRLLAIQIALLSAILIVLAVKL